MGDLLEWNEKIVFNKDKVITAIQHTLYKGVDKILNLKWFLKKEENSSKKISFKIIPSTKALSYPQNVNLNKDNIFRMRVFTKNLPEKWEGELHIKEEGFVKKIPLIFEKTQLFH